MPEPHKRLRRHLILIGARASGKSTVARLLARQISAEFLDLDESIALLAGTTVAELFQKQGEAVFREREALALRDALRLTPRVIAVGGGAVLREENRENMARCGDCVWLTAGADELRRRMAADPASQTGRPALTAGGDALIEVEQVLAARTPIYERIAAVRVVTEGKTPQQVATEIAEWLREWREKGGGG